MTGSGNLYADAQRRRALAKDARNAHDSIMEDRISALEGDMKDVKAILGRIEPKLSEMHTFMTATLPHLATKTDLSGLRTDMVAGDAALRKDVKSDMDRDFRITWGGLIAAALGLAGLMAKGFEWL